MLTVRSTPLHILYIFFFPKYFATYFPDEDDPWTGNEWVHKLFPICDGNNLNPLQKDQQIELSALRVLMPISST